MSAVLPAAAPPLTKAPGFWKRASRHPSFMIGAVLTVLLIAAAALSLVWTPFNPYDVNMAAKLLEEDRPSKLTVRDQQGNVLSTWGASDPCALDGFAAPHGMWVDSRGDIYVGEVTHTALSAFYKTTTWHADCASLTKFARI